MPSWRYFTFVLMYLAVGSYCARASSLCSAYLRVQVNSSSGLNTSLANGLFGRESPRHALTGPVLLADPVDACSPTTHFGPHGALMEPGWIALIKRNDCTFTEKINKAAEHQAAAAVIYNNDDETENTLLQMSHPGTFIVAVMIGNADGAALARLLQEGVSITMEIKVGQVFEPIMGHYSIFLISISFIIIAAAAASYFTYYTARRLYRARVQDRMQKRMKAKAKAAISRLQTRTLAHGDQECVGSDDDSCAVCIEVYKPGDIVSVLTCSHYFHKVCIEPWLLEHRTCPMCKCDVLKALGVQVDDNSPPDLLSSTTEDSLTHINTERNTYINTHSSTHIESVSLTLNDAVPSGYESTNSAGDTQNGTAVV
ncbi:E3 ubiquitin-protein ligase RNF128a isoform X2 [Hoplias malabaricus]|uniref:E3 ubiquitin-protein ligase RNF128a isoform X2 n=1 Tax=Hoplias malabaricus TaxID=27720 RepID=UPI0034617BA9